MDKYPLDHTLAARALRDDPRIVEAKRLLKEAVKEHQTEITHVRPPTASLKQNYQELIDTLSQYRGGKLWFPYIGSGIGNGALVELADGSVKYDFISGIGVHYFGHSHPDLIDAAVDAAVSDTLMQGHLQQNIDSLELSHQLVKASGLPHCFLTTSGAMANENALKVAFQNRHPANRVLAFERCFVGRTLTLSQITDKPTFREGLPLSLPVDYVPFFDSSHPEESTARAVNALKKHIARYPKQHAVMCMEFVQGEGGFYSGTSEFFKALMTILKDNQIAIFADEIQTFGRTEELFAFQYFGLQSYVDIASIGKLSQVCATFFTDAYKPKVGLLSQTFTGSTSSIKAAQVILHELTTGGYYGPSGKIHRLHTYFTGQLQALSQRHPQLVQGPFGIGSMIAFTPYNGSADVVTDFTRRLFEAGVIGFIAGANPTRIRFLIPAVVIKEKEIDEAVKIIEKTLLDSPHAATGKKP